MRKSTTRLMTLVILFMLCVWSVNATTTYYSTGNVTASTLTNWKTARDGTGTSPANFTAGDIFVVQGTGGGSGAPHSMTCTSTLSISGTGSKLWIESGATLTATAAITLNSASTLQIDNGGTYVHNHTGAISAILAGTEVIGATSNFNVSAIASITAGTVVSAPGLGNFTYTGGATMQCNGSFPTLQGNLTVSSAGLRFNGSTAGSSSCTINGDLIINSTGQLEWGNGTVKDYTVYLKGNINITSSAANPILFAGTGGVSGTPVNAYLVLNGTGTQTFSSTSSTAIVAASSSYRVFNLTVNSGATLSMGTSTLNSAGSTNVYFTLSSGATLITGNANGITSGLTGTGSIQNLGGSRTFSTGANYSYSGGVAQITGTGLPSTVNNLTMNNTSGGVTLSAPTTVSGVLTMTNGILTTTGTNLLTLGSAATVSGGSTSSFVSGPMQHTIASTSSTAKTFPLGKGSFYAPVVLTITQSAATSTTYNAEVFASGIPSRTLPGTISAVSTSRYYALSSSGSLISNGSIGLVYDANDAGISTGTAGAMRIVNDQGGAAWVDQGPVSGGSSPITSSTNFTTLGNFAIANAPLGTPPTVSTQAVSVVGSTTATGNGTISDSGSSNITTSGVCWSTTLGAENVSGSHSTDGPTGASPGAFTSSMTGLAPGQTYYVKAYAQNTETIGYGSEVSVLTLGSVTTTSISALAQYTASSGGTITCAGAYSQKGVCWSTSVNPTIADSKTTDGSGSGNVSYASSISGLSANTGYHVRAYVTNATGTTYGADIPFTTLAETPTITLSKSSLTDFGSVTANKTSTTQTYTVSGSFLTSSVTITPPAGFQISNDGGSSWVSNPNTIVLTQTAGSLDAQPVTITARFNPNAVSSFSANITHTATDATTQNVAVSGTGIAVTNPTALTVSKKSDNIVYLTWTAPSGSYDKVLVFAQVATDVTVSPSGAGSAYTGDNLAWGSASTYGAGSDKLVYSGTGTSAEITGLTNGQTYYFKVYSYSGDSYGATPASTNFTAAVQPTTALAGTIANASSVLTWTNPTYNVTQGNYWDEILVLAKSGSAVDATPSGDGSSYTANAAFGSGTDLGSGNFVVYKGTGATQTVTGLTNNTAYYYAAFVRHGSAWSTANTANATPNAYVNGDYRARVSGNWGLNASPNTWEKYNGTTWSNCNTTDIPNSTTVNVFIPAGISVNVETSNRSVNNITVEGTLTSSGSNSSLYYLNIYGNLTVNTGGYIGSVANPTGDSFDGISFKFYGAASTINGSGGSIYVARMLTQLASQTLTINHNMTANYHGSTNQGGHTVAVYPAADNTTITIAAGKTLTMAPWAVIGTTSSSNGLQTYNFTINVNGTLDVQDTPFPNVQSPSAQRSFIYGGAGTGKTFSLNIGSTGVVNAPQFYPNGTTSGGGIPTGTTSTVSIASGGVLNISQTLDLRQVNQTISGSGTFNLLSGATLRVGNASGIDAQIVSTSPSLSSSAIYQFEGTTSQVTGSLLPSSVAALTIANSAGVSLSTNTVADALTINASSILNVPTNKKLTVNTTMTNNGTINLLSDATGTATILTPATISGTGTANVQQYLATGRNWYISSPVSGATAAVFNPEGLSNLLYSYDEVHGSSSSLAWPAITSNATSLTVMKGYVANMASSGVVTFSGSLNNGAQEIVVTRTQSQIKAGFNLVGNPYPSYLDWSNVTKTNLLTTMWYRTKTSGDVYTFDTYNATGDIATSNGAKAVTNMIPPMQAFWVRVDGSPVTGTLSVSNAQRAHADNSSNTFKAKATIEAQPVIRLQVSNGVNSDQALIYYNAGATNGFDSYDSPKLSNESASIPEIYTLAGSEQLVINGVNDATELALGFTTGQANNFTIKASQFANFAAGTQIILRDNMLNYEQDLTLADYNFYSDVTANNETRFTLLVKAPSVATGINANTNNNVWVSLNGNNQIVVNGATGETSVAVYNEVGQRILSQRLTASTKALGNFVPGVYLVTVTNAGKIATQKVIIK